MSVQNGGIKYYIAHSNGYTCNSVFFSVLLKIFLLKSEIYFYKISLKQKLSTKRNLSLHRNIST